MPADPAGRGLGSGFNDLVTVVIPTLNEVEGIGRVIDELLSYGFSRDQILVVDGGSTDGTVDVVRSKGVKLIYQDGRGKAAAVATALKYVKTPYVLIMDGDYTYPAKYATALVERALSGYDEVIGARRYGNDVQKPAFRFGNKVLTTFFNILFGTKLSDVLSGMYVVRTDRLTEVAFEMSGFSLESEVAAHIASTSQRITEVPIEYRLRLGRKKLGIRHGFQIARDMVRLAWRYNPVFLIFALGSLLLIPGLALGAWVAYHYFFTGVNYYIRGIIAVFLTAVGLQSLLTAIMALYMKRVELRINRKLDELRNAVSKPG